VSSSPPLNTYPLRSMGLSVAQIGPLLKIFSKNRIFSARTAVVMRAWKFWLLITLEVSPTESEGYAMSKVNDY